MNILTNIKTFFFGLLSLAIPVLPAAFDFIWDTFTNYFLDNFVVSPSIVAESEFIPAGDATITAMETELTVSQQKIQQLLKRHDELESQNKRLLEELENLAQKVSEQADRTLFILLEQCKKKLVDLISDCYQKVAKLQNEKLNSSLKDAPLLAKPEKSVETEFVNEETSALPELPSCIPDSNCYVENEQKSVDEVDVYQELFTEEEMTSTELTPMPQIADETRGFPSDLPHVDPICQPKWDSDEYLDEDEPAVQQEKNEAVADESSSLSGFREVKTING
jgi:isoleucyl-tRNA synthetase